MLLKTASALKTAATYLTPHMGNKAVLFFL